MILIVDDIPENLYSLKSVLEHHNFNVETASSGEEALKKILKTNYVLILLDVQMPGMDGFEVAEILSGYSKAKNTAIIFLSANYTDANFILQGYKHGAIDYITKPIDPSLLLTRVKALYEIIQSRTAIQKQQEEIKTLFETEKKLNLSLSRQRKRLLLTQKLTKIATWEYYIENESLKCSPEVYTLLELNNDEQIDFKHFLKRLNAEDYQNFTSVWEQFTTKGGRLEFIHSYQNPKGYTQYFKQYGKLELRNGVPYKILGCVQDITEEKNNEKEFLKLYQRYMLVNKATNDIISDWDIMKDVTEFNDNITIVLGYPEKTIERPETWWKNTIHPEDVEKMSRAFEYAISRGETKWSSECRLKCFDGSFKEVFSQSFCLYNSSRQLTRMITATKDLSLLKSVENQLQKAELKLLQTVETINEGFFTCNSSWEITYWNNKSEEILKFTKEEALGKNLWDLFPQAKESSFYNLYENCLKYQRPASIEEYYAPLEKWFRVNVHPNEEGIAVYFEDVTGELLKDSELNKALEKTELIKATSHDVIWETNIGSEIFHFNKNLYQQYGFAPGTRTDSVWFRERIHAEDITRVEENVNKCIQNGSDFCEHEYRFLDVDGNYHFVHGKVYIIRDENRNPVQMAGSIVNLQDLKEKESRLAKIAFSNSHLLRKPLANILGLIDLLDDQDSKNNADIINLIKESSLELDEIIKQIAKISH